MLILIPIMLSADELKGILGQVPDDFEEASSEFWNYVEEKLKPFKSKICVVYSNELSFMSDTGKRLDIILKFKGQAQYLCVDDPLLTAEAKAWLDLIKNESSQIALDLFEDNMNDRIKYASEVINKNLRDGGIGIFLPIQKISFIYLKTLK